MKWTSGGSSMVAWLTMLLPLYGCVQTYQGNQPETAEARVPNSATWNVTSESGRTYQIQVSLPLGYETTSASYPAVYLLDANGQFGMTTEIVRYLSLENNLPGLVVVGVGYPVGQFFNAIVPRAFDLTPDRETDVENTIEGWLSSRREYTPGRPVMTGGAAAFLAFLTRELIPDVESRFRIDRTGRTLIGHSLGGLFALQTLLEQPASFANYLVISPHLPDTERPIFRREAELDAASWSPSARLYITVGANDLAGYLDGARRFAERLASRNYRDLQWTFSVRQDESHNSVVPGAISTGIRWLYSDTSGASKPGA